MASFCVPYSPKGGVAVSSVIGRTCETPARQIDPQWTRWVRLPRSARTSCSADPSVKQTRSTTASAPRAAIRSPNVPSRSSCSRSAVIRSTCSHSGASAYGLLVPRVTTLTRCPARTRRGTRKVPMWPVAPMTTMSMRATLGARPRVRQALPVLPGGRDGDGPDTGRTGGAWRVRARCLPSGVGPVRTR